MKELKAVIEKQSSQIKQYEEEVQLLNDPATPEEKVDLIEKVVEMEDKEVCILAIKAKSAKYTKVLKSKKKLYF